MTPNSRYFPTKLQDRAAWYQNFATQFTSLRVALGFPVGDGDVVTADNDMMQFIAESSVAVDNFSDANRQFKLAVFEGNPGDPTPSIPAYTSPGSPTEVPAGMFERLDNLVKRIRLSPTYTEEMGALLGIIPSSPDRPAPSELQPVLKAKAEPGNIVNVSFKRGYTDGIAVEIKVDNAGTWNDAGRFVKSPAMLEIPENPQGLPRSVQVRARYVDGDTEVGLYSQVDTVSTLPAA